MLYQKYTMSLLNANFGIRKNLIYVEFSLSETDLFQSKSLSQQCDISSALEEFVLKYADKLAVVKYFWKLLKTCSCANCSSGILTKGVPCVYRLP